MTSGFRMKGDIMGDEKYVQTRSFWKVMFSAQEILDLVTECDSLGEFERRFIDQAEERSRE